MAGTYTPVDRRPIASRKQQIWIAAAGWLARARVSANMISVAGMLFAIVAGICAAMTSQTSGVEARILWLLVAAGVQLRLLANMLDGMVAIQTSTASPVGELYNEVPDRVSDVAVFVGMGYAAGGSVGMGAVAAGLAVFTAYVRAACKAAGAAQDYCGPMAKPHRMFLVTVIAIFMALAPGSWQVVWHGWGIPAVTLAVIALGCLITSVRRLMRGARRLRGDNV